MNAGDLAGYIERYLEADDSGNSAANGSAVSVDSGTRQQFVCFLHADERVRMLPHRPPDMRHQGALATERLGWILRRGIWRGELHYVGVVQVALQDL